MSNTIKTLTSLFNKQPILSEQEITLLVELYALARQQQQFAQSVLQLLEHQVEQEQARQIIAQDTLLRKTKGKLLTLVEQIRDAQQKATLLDLLRH